MVLSDTKIFMEIVTLFVGADCDKDLDSIMNQYSLRNDGKLGRGANQPTSAFKC